MNPKGFAVGEYNDGVCKVEGDLFAKALINLDHDFGVEGKIHAPFVNWDDGNLEEMLVPDVFKDEEVSVTRILTRHRAGEPVLKSEVTAKR